MTISCRGSCCSVQRSPAILAMVLVVAVVKESSSYEVMSENPRSWAAKRSVSIPIGLVLPNDSHLISTLQYVACPCTSRPETRTCSHLHTAVALRMLEEDRCRKIPKSSGGACSCVCHSSSIVALAVLVFLTCCRCLSLISSKWP
jgi:hypothetical protein